MRRKQRQTTVRKTTASNVEGSMLGKVILWVSERKNSKYAQRPHRTYQRKQPTKSVFRVHEGLFKLVAECIQTAPTACWRRLKDLISFSNKYGRRLASVMRKQKRNGK